MSSPAIERQQLIESIRNLPDAALFELASFLNYLHFKTIQSEEPSSAPTFLGAITGIGTSGQTDISC